VRAIVPKRLSARAVTCPRRTSFPARTRAAAFFRCSSAFFIIWVLSAAAFSAAETPIPAAPAQWVTDTANFMSPGAASSLNSRLEDYERSTGHQLIVYIAQTTGDAPIDDWAVRAFEKWKVGRKGIDDGLVLFIMAADRKLRFEVGYGLEPIVPDVIASRVINDVITPRIQAGDRDGAVNAGMDAVMSVIGGGSLPAPQRDGRRGGRPMTLGQLILFAIIGVIALFVLATNPSLALFLLASILSGGGGRRDRDGWGGGGGGGWSGGGGRSGGGGASGSW
jgi:uncharacterized protein